MHILRRTRLSSDKLLENTFVLLALQGLGIGHIILHLFLRFQQRIELKSSNSLAGYSVHLDELVFSPAWGKSQMICRFANCSASE